MTEHFAQPDFWPLLRIHSCKWGFFKPVVRVQIPLERSLSPMCRVAHRESIPQRAGRIGMGGAPRRQKTRCQRSYGYHCKCRPERQRVAWAHFVKQVPK